MPNGEWELTPQQQQDIASKRGNGRCYWWGCNGPGWKPNPSMVNWPKLRDNPLYRLCSKHYDEAQALNAKAATITLDAIPAVHGVWETPVKPMSKRRAARHDMIERNRARNRLHNS